MTEESDLYILHTIGVAVEGARKRRIIL